jgi:hypothetical protein
MKLSTLRANPTNPRIIKDEKFQKLVKSIEEFPEMLEARPIVVNPEMIVIGGNMRFKACKAAGLKEAPVYMATWGETKDREFIIKDNVSSGENDFDILANEWDAVELADWGLDVWQPEKADKASTQHELLTDTFVVPPLSVLDTRQGYWKDRKAVWHERIQDHGESREMTLSQSDNIMSKINNGVSLLDPVLAEIANRWFALPECNTFDCFAGDSVFGYVSDALGNTFTGIELRPEQADLNNNRLQGRRSRYICDDGRNVAKHIPAASQDLLFSCPPYFDLEVYSNLPDDASNQKDYTSFMQLLSTAFTEAIKCLKPNRFAFIVVGDLRGPDGAYYNFPNGVKDIFISAGMVLYNEMVLVEPLGTLPQRVRRYMTNRKVGKCHQNVLVFYKGNTKDISKTYPQLKIQFDADFDA